MIIFATRLMPLARLVDHSEQSNLIMRKEQDVISMQSKKLETIF